MKIKKLKLFCLIFGAITFASCKKEKPAKEIQDVSPKDQQLERQNFGPRNWMMSVPDEKNISQLSIPGTHNSAARVDLIMTKNTSKCQELTISQQLEIGVRFLDIRCRHLNQSFAIHHGPVYQELNFNDILTSCYDFLRRNPSETIIMSLKEEHTPENNRGETFQTRFEAYIKQAMEKWDLNPEISTLGSMRGKIKLLRRFPANKTLGIDATNWKDRETFEINNAANLKIQDKYLVSSGQSKWNSVETLLTESNNDLSNRLYINFGSGYSTREFLTITVSSYSRAGSDYVNPQIEKMFDGNLNGKYGIIPLDFIDKTLSEKIINTNQLRQKISKYNNEWNYDLEYPASLKYDIWLPAKRNKNTTPLFVFIHGGSFLGGDKRDSEYMAAVNAIIAEFPDCAVATINYRTGLTPLELILGDVTNAVKEIVLESEQMNISNQQIVLVGESAGAYLALYEGLRNGSFNGNQVKYKAIVSISGFAHMYPTAVDLKSWAQVSALRLKLPPRSMTRPGYDFSPKEWISDRQQIPELYLFAGKDDKILATTNSVDIETAVKKSKYPAVQSKAYLKLYEGQGHTMDDATRKDIARILKERIRF